MHELPIIKSVFKTVSAKAEEAGAKSVTRVVLEVGILRDFIPEFVEKYWAYITPGTIAEGSVIEIKEVGASAKCGQCGHIYRFTKDQVSNVWCPHCGYAGGKLLSGSELKIRGIEIKRETDNN